MQTKKPRAASEWVDPDDAPHLTREWFERADLTAATRWFAGEAEIR